MTKKKKISIALLLVVLFVAGFFSYQQYQTYSQKKHEEYLKILDVYSAITVEDDTSKYGNPVLDTKISELKKNPLKVEMNGNEGLYIYAMAYEYYTEKAVDYLDIEQLMNSGQMLEVYTKYQDYIDWNNARSTTDKNYRANYYTAVTNTAITHQISLGPSSSHEDYKKIIEAYPDEISSEIAAIS